MKKNNFNLSITQIRGIKILKTALSKEELQKIKGGIGPLIDPHG